MTIEDPNSRVAQLAATVRDCTVRAHKRKLRWMELQLNISRKKLMILELMDKDALEDLPNVDQAIREQRATTATCREALDRAKRDAKQAEDYIASIINSIDARDTDMEDVAVAIMEAAQTATTTLLEFSDEVNSDSSPTTSPTY